MQYLYKNIKSHSVKLPNKNGKLIHFAPGEKKILDDYFRKYVPKHLAIMKIVNKKNNLAVKKDINKIVNEHNVIRRVKAEKTAANRAISIGRKNRSVVRVVGRASKSGRRNATEFSQSRIDQNSIAISNNIGIGILSFNRIKSLIPLIESIRKHTDLNKTTIFVSDESTDPAVWSWLSNQNDIVTFHSDRGGIAVNSNRLLRCLSRFKYKMILNDDVEVLKDGWDKFYFDAMEKTGKKHFCYRQNGIYGAVRPKSSKNGIISVNEKPHGAVMAIHEDAFKKVGFFDESFGVYGFEHVDYSDRINVSCHNNNQYIDFDNSDKYFKIYDDTSSDPNKHENYQKAKDRYNAVKNNNDRIYVGKTGKSLVPGITCIIPFRDIGREKCIATVVNNIKAQRYPVVQIIISEQDGKSRIDKRNFECVEHILVKNWIKNMHFSKSSAFNCGVTHAEFDKMVLHDADMLVRSDYFKKISDLLDNYESAHIGQTVCYMEKESTDKIVGDQEIDRNKVSSDRIVGYYEGGSFGITKTSYVRIGGFCEDFIGYGCEDCEFYKRMTENTKSYTVRSIDLFHLWHDRTDGWTERHNINKEIQNKMFKEKPSRLCERLNKQLLNKYKEIL